jgi:predicted N-formylglutamate amidohydrolase
MTAGAWVVSCEHGGKRIPPAYTRYFARRQRLLDSHRGYDAGALVLARQLAEVLPAPLFAATVSRLLVDLNRSPGHPQLFSAASRQASAAVRREILERHYRPYREAVEAEIAAGIAAGRPVVHIASHSFTPRLHGVLRRADIGLLYDPRRAGEVEFCRRWRAALKANAPQLTVRRNYPYSGRSDGLTAYLRRRFAGSCYIGIELEVNQRHVDAGARHWRQLREAVVRSLLAVRDEMGAAG